MIITIRKGGGKYNNIIIRLKVITEKNAFIGKCNLD